MNVRIVSFLLPLAFGIGACAERPLAPEATTHRDLQPLFQRPNVDGTGLVLNSVTGLTVPLLNVDLGDVVIEQAVVKEFGVVENAVGQIIGLEASGVLKLSGDALGTEVVTQDFTTRVGVVSSGGGRCDVVTIDLAPIRVDAIGGLAAVDVPAATVGARGSGALGSLLCALGQLADPLLDRVAEGVRGLVNAVNNLIP